MNGKKHKTPSRMRYENNNPVFSVRMPKAWHDKLNKHLKDTGQSRKDFLGIALGIKAENYEHKFVQWYDMGYNKGYQFGRDKGLDEGREKWALKCYCCYCGAPLYIGPNSNAHTIILEYFKEHPTVCCPGCSKE
ncbi:hypothetical protein AYK25_10220 [Thermoplasmatales archaeon SM1-50]|nr:MAG: hypothetical protein AYK25_10220 [Thermoplasmatales archaeon SM1-50]